ncbi:murein hydrolase activator EnvC family protein [Alloalcanivorax mobilis]|uniref:murein hydrolase activator EnvC family protein n=1 Tax=Alloalcanivorax mobilis TaxID=2019569 RepID=UPI000B5B1214|nr:peptidoglycan DD-metalloendopeptidase family protein [Alloalcanivorax mobilis]ASK32937.1 peptidase M23 [Alcanivorax sp. N3-2A]ASK36755.1 peptidase M23 [Alcanivorax sp. N3-2A]|tara:strand:- start:4870 stop:6024 length:1155 start_codon:yes stop_codon:yes gene_type:complete
MKPVFLLLLLIPVLLRAEQASPQQLKELKARIETLSEAQNQDLEERDSQRASLRTTETRISKLVRERRALENDARAAQRRLDGLEKHQARLAEEKKLQLQWLAKTVRASYETGREERIKLLLNQQDPERIARLLRYQEYFQRARTKRLTALQGELVELRQVAEQVNAARADLLDRRTELAAHEKRLKGAVAEREQNIASLNRSLDQRGSNIAGLRQDQKHLEKLLEDMRRTLPGVPPDAAGKPFGTLDGKLPWPVPGKVLSGFNSTREGALRWDGVILAADTGTPVRAIHPGRVVFADWMRGYGLLIILDHGGGYLTLYGYNQSLLREVGEWVATGDVLALAGRSGGNARSALYFEIRHRGKVVNPARWCDHRVTLPPIARTDD